MALRLYVVHGSHPCAAVQKALALKGLRFSVREWPPPLQPVIQAFLFGRPTVPALRNGAEKIVGSRAIMHRLDEMVPEPALYPADPELRARVEEADRWGDEELQQVARDVIWAGFAHRPGALVSYGEHSLIPLPKLAIRASAPAIARAELLLQRTGDAKARRRLDELPAQLERVEAWIEQGTIGDLEHPNAADLQILSTVRLLSTIADARPALAGGRAEQLARALFPEWDGELPAGSIPAAA